jgi:ATP-dependent Clp protease ATP-binding subunit ClpC
MNEFPTTLHFLQTQLEPSGDGTPQVFVQPLRYPELSSLGRAPSILRRRQMDLAADMLAEEPHTGFQHRELPAEPQMDRVTVSVSPAKKSEAWSEPVEVAIEYAWWRHDKAAVAWMPSLQIAALVAKEQDLVKEVLKEARAAITRQGWNKSLQALGLLMRGETKLHASPWNPWPRTPKERWNDENSEEKRADALKELTSKMEPRQQPAAWEREIMLERLVRLISAEDEPSVLLVGPSGVGKTALIQQMVRQHGQEGFPKRNVHRTSGARLVAGACGFGMWQQRCRDLIAEAKKQDVILFVGNLFELANTGQSSAGNESIASFFRGHLVRREIQLCAECTPEQYSLLEKQDPRLLDAFRILRVEPPDDAAVDRILLTESLRLGNATAGARFTEEAVTNVAMLHRRYATLSAFPGRALQFMRQVNDSVPQDRCVESADVYTAFSHITGMPTLLLDPLRKLRLAEVKSFFQHRVRGQDSVSEALMEMISRIKASLTRSGRPLASFLFVGPTGTGKTESAKALAAWLFQNESRLIRIDASEYQNHWSAQRLVSGSRDGREGILTAAVREHPFSVVLIDEIEKAHSSVFDLLLQVLGEARLTDAAGRTADFSNCVVIMTSNLGAETFGRNRLGFQAEKNAAQQATEHFADAVRKAVRPEFFNRIDRIVPFFPLPQEIVRELAKREIELVLQRPGLAGAHLNLTVPEEITHRLADSGWDERYGARPLKRTVSQQLLVPLADFLATQRIEKSTIETRAEGRQNALRFTAQRNPSAVPSSVPSAKSQVLANASNLRRQFEWLLQHTMFKGLRSRVNMLDQRLAAARRLSKAQGVFLEPQKDRDALTRFLRKVTDAAETQRNFEESLVLDFCQDTNLPNPPNPWSHEDWNALLMEMLRRWEEPAAAMVLVIQASSGAEMFTQAKLYRELAEDYLHAQVTIGFYSKKPTGKLLTVDEKTKVQSALPEIPETEAEMKTCLDGSPKGIGAVGLWIQGAEAVLYLQNESGLQVAVGAHAEAGKKKGDDVPMSDQWRSKVTCYQPTDELTQLRDLPLLLTDLNRPDLNTDKMRRQIDLMRATCKDALTSKTTPDYQPGPYWLHAQLQRDLMERAGWTDSTRRELS